MVDLGRPSGAARGGHLIWAEHPGHRGRGCPCRAHEDMRTAKLDYCCKSYWRTASSSTYSGTCRSLAARHERVQNASYDGCLPPGEDVADGDTAEGGAWPTPAASQQQDTVVKARVPNQFLHTVMLHVGQALSHLALAIAAVSWQSQQHHGDCVALPDGLQYRK